MLVPFPQLHLIRFHGVLTPNATLLSQIIPGESDGSGLKEKTIRSEGCGCLAGQATWGHDVNWSCKALQARCGHHEHIGAAIGREDKDGG